MHLAKIATALIVSLFGFAITPDLFAQPADSPKQKLVCFGDSITKRGYNEILQQLLNVDTVNSGVAGNSTAQALRRMKKDVLNHNPDIVVIFFGTNDLRIDAPRVHVTLDDYRVNLKTMIDKCRAQKAKVVLCTPPPIDREKYYERHEPKMHEAVGGIEKLLQDYRTAAIEVAKANSVPLVDLNRLLAKTPEWMSHDGVHPSKYGTAVIARHVLKAVAPLVNKVSQPVTETDADILVFGATSAGVVAAVQAARMNKTVILIEPHDHIGGLTTGGLGATDIGNKDVIGGLSREFYRRVAKHYQKDESWVHETREEFFQKRSKRTKLSEVLGEDATMWTFAPSVAQRIFDQLLKESGIIVRRQQKLAAVKKDGTKIVSIKTQDGNVYAAKVFIDATYEGDLMAKAGVSYRVGREANSEYNETLNGIRDKTPKNQIHDRVDPYVVPGDPSSGLIPLIAAGDAGKPGDGDHRVQAYNFRLCFTDVVDNRMQLKPPQGYDPALYELAARRAEKIVALNIDPVLKHFCNPVWMPNRKTDINNSEGISTDFIGANYEYPDADYDRRAKIWQAHAGYVRGFWYFMSTSPRVPENLRKQFLEFGPCRDEFTSNDGFSTQMYVREARRMVGSYVMTEHNCRSKTIAKDSVGMAAYGMDSHNCQRVVKDGAAVNEGDVQQHGLKPYPISYRSIVPRKSECENLLVPVCVSATHIAFGSIRMEPVFMSLGHSSAVAASLAVDNSIAVQDIDYGELRRLLWASGQVLSRPKPKAKKPKQSSNLVVPTKKRSSHSDQ